MTSANVPSIATRHRQTDKINETFTRSQQPLFATSFAATNTYVRARVNTRQDAYIQRCANRREKDRSEESRVPNIHDSIGNFGNERVHRLSNTNRDKKKKKKKKRNIHIKPEYRRFSPLS